MANIINYTRQKTVDTTGELLLEFNPKTIDSLLLTPSKDIYLGFNELSNALYPILASSSLSLTWLDFRPSGKSENIRIYAKGQTESSVVTIHYIGR